MPATGYDPQQPGAPPSAIDPVGHSPDPSAYYALSPGGRFPGDVWMYLEALAAQDPTSDRSGNRADPNYDLPAWLERVPGRMGNIIARLVRGHEWNVRNNDDAPLQNPLAGNPYQGWSGPGAQYGPEGGPLHGTLDQGNTHIGDYDYGTPGVGALAPGTPDKPRRGGRGNDFGPLNFTPYAGTPHTAQFVDYQPIAPFMSDTSPTRMVAGRGGTPVGGTSPQVPVPTGPARGGGGRGQGGRQGAGGGPGANAGAGGRPRGGAPSAGTPSLGDAGLPSDLPPELLALLSELMGSSRPLAGGRRPYRNPTPQDIAAGFGERGFDTGYTFRGTPGWVSDPTTGIINTAGMPRGTPPARSQFDTDDAYMGALHDLGYGAEDIMGLMNGWGTGGVVRGPNGYVFANDPSAQENPNPSSFNPGVWFEGDYADSPGARGQTTNRSGGGGGSAQPNAADSLMSGWNPYLI